MLELIKKSILAGIGAVVLTKEKVQEATRTLVKEGKISTEEAEKLADDLIKSGERHWEEFNTRMSDSSKKWSDSFDLVKKRDYQELKARLEMLDQRVTILEETQRKAMDSVSEMGEL